MLALGVLLAGERMTAMPSAWSLGWLAYQTFWVVSLTFAVWFAMVQRYSASRLSAFTFLTPLFGVASGHFVLGEPVSWGFGAAVALVIAGLVLVNRPN
jgi:drug/metabolite transporter (DMT)-like permease